MPNQRKRDIEALFRRHDKGSSKVTNDNIPEDRNYDLVKENRGEGDPYENFAGLGQSVLKIIDGNVDALLEAELLREAENPERKHNYLELK